MKNLKRNTLGILLALIATVAFAAAGDRFIENPTSNADIILNVTKAGVKTTVLKAVGSTGLVSVSLGATAMSDADATRLGLKSYSHGTNYNGGVAPTISMSGGPTLSAATARFIPYQLQDGVWRLKIIISATATGAFTAGNVLINGITFSAPTTSFSCINNAATAVTYCTTNDSTNVIQIIMTSNNLVYISGEAILTSKPTWAY